MSKKPIWTIVITGKGPFRVELQRNRRWKGQIGFSIKKDYAAKIARRYAEELSITFEKGR